MKPLKHFGFKFTFHGPMTRQLFELGGVAPVAAPGHFGVGSGTSRLTAITSAIGGFRNTAAAPYIEWIAERVQMNLQPEWQEPEGSDEDNTLMFCIIEVELE